MLYSHEQILTRHFFKFTFWIHSISLCKGFSFVRAFCNIFHHMGLVLFCSVLTWVPTWCVHWRNVILTLNKNPKLVDGCVILLLPSLLSSSSNKLQNNLNWYQVSLWLQLEEQKFTANCTDPTVGQIHGNRGFKWVDYVLSNS